MINSGLIGFLIGYEWLMHKNEQILWDDFYKTSLLEAGFLFGCFSLDVVCGMILSMAISLVSFVLSF